MNGIPERGGRVSAFGGRLSNPPSHLHACLSVDREGPAGVGQVSVPITRKSGSILHADSHSGEVLMFRVPALAAWNTAAKARRPGAVWDFEHIDPEVTHSVCTEKSGKTHTLERRYAHVARSVLF